MTNRDKLIYLEDFDGRTNKREYPEIEVFSSYTSYH